MRIPRGLGPLVATLVAGSFSATGPFALAATDYASQQSVAAPLTPAVAFAPLQPTVPAFQLSSDVYALPEAVTKVGATAAAILLLQHNDLFLQITNAFGQAVGTPRQVNAVAGTARLDGGMLTTLTNGNLVAVWLAQGTGTDYAYHVFCRILQPNGTPVSPELRIDTTATDRSGNPAVAALSNGGFVVVWGDRPTNPLVADIRGRVMTAAGKPVGSEFLLDGGGTRYADPRVAALASGFVIVHEGQGQVLARRFNLTGGPVGGAIRLDSTNIRVHEGPAVTALSNGGYAAIWEENTYGTVTGMPVVADRILHGRFVSSTGIAGTQFTIDDPITAKGVEGSVGLAAFGAGLLTSWSLNVPGATDNGYSSTRGQEVRLVEVAADGTLGSFMTVNPDSSLDQRDARLAILSNNRPLVVFRDTSYVPNTAPRGALGTFLDPARINAIPIVGTPASDPTLRGAETNDAIRGLDGNDRLYGLAGYDNLNGGPGNDQLFGGTGENLLTGGLGNDTYRVETGRDRIVELAGQGIDTVIATASFALAANVENLTLQGARAVTGVGDAGPNRLIGNALNNRLYGLAGNDTLDGGDGDDFLDGGPGADRLSGGLGYNTYVVDASGDTVIASTTGGGDTVWSSVSFVLAIGVEAVQLTGTGHINADGNELANRMTGNDGDNILKGFAGNDVIAGGKGNDQIDGGVGSDLLDGDEGDDILTGGSARDAFTFKGRFGHDTIKEFSVTDWDLMYFALVDFPTSAAAIAAARQQGTDTVIQTADGRSVRLKNFNVNNLTSDAVRVD
jgi:Ca2+-binding RTX toxin-like protein